MTSQNQCLPFFFLMETVGKQCKHTGNLMREELSETICSPTHPDRNHSKTDCQYLVSTSKMQTYCQQITIRVRQSV